MTHTHTVQQHMLHKVFAALDQNHSNHLSHLELFNGLGQLMAGSKETKAEYFFALYDMDNSGSMSKDEVGDKHPQHWFVAEHTMHLTS